jgi:hypothetical protein
MDELRYREELIGGGMSNVKDIDFIISFIFGFLTFFFYQVIKHLCSLKPNPSSLVYWVERCY